MGMLGAFATVVLLLSSAPNATACDAAPAYAAAAARNAQSLTSLEFAPFHRPEIGWEVYAPLAAQEIGSDCRPGSEAFAAALARWQQSRGLPADGVMSAAVFQEMKGLWQERRGFVMATKDGDCPPAPPEESLDVAGSDETAADTKPMRLRPAAMAAFRRMLADARAAVPDASLDRRLLTPFSAYRSPSYDAARCAHEHNCQGVVRAACSAHRTGLAMDVFVGALPGTSADSSDDANRLYQSHSPAYLWLVKHAAEYGFVVYPFEPWHWEWTGEGVWPQPPAAPVSAPPVATDPAPASEPGAPTTSSRR
jgi:zinc D-Ala-D-Ala carboxypeptidase